MHFRNTVDTTAKRLAGVYFSVAYYLTTNDSEDCMVFGTKRKENVLSLDHSNSISR